MTLPKDRIRAKEAPVALHEAERANIRAAAAKAANDKIRPLAGEHPKHAAHRWNQLYWQEWGERMEAAGLRPYWERGRPAQEPVWEDDIRYGKAA